MPVGEATAALAGVRVLDLTTVVFGPYATQTLADYGADVIKVEAPAGDPMRAVGPSFEPGLGALFLGINRNKRSVVLDLKTAVGREALMTLVDTADVLVHSMRPAKAAALGLDPDRLCAARPRLIHVALTGFGAGGEYAGRPAYDDVIQGLSGAADLMHRQTGQMRYLPTIAADKTAGLAAVHAVLAALFQRERTGLGQQVEVPMLETMTSFLLAEHYQGRHLLASGDDGATEPADDGNDAGAPGDAGSVESRRAAGYSRVLSIWRRPYATLDGYVCLMPYSNTQWQRFFLDAGKPELAADPRFATLELRTRNIDALYEAADAIVAGRTTEQWLIACDAMDIPVARINRLEDLDDDPHLRSVGFFTDLTDGVHRYRFPGNPIRLQNSRVEPTMPPRLGEHTVEVLRTAGVDEQLIAELTEPDPG